MQCPFLQKYLSTKINNCGLSEITERENTKYGVFVTFRLNLLSKNQLHAQYSS